MRLGRMPVGRRRRGKHTFPLFYEDADLEILENIPLKDLLKTLTLKSLADRLTGSLTGSLT